MQFWQTKFGAIVGVLLLCWALVVGFVGYRVHQITHPDHQADGLIDFGAIGTQVEPVTFPAVDGVTLSGLLMEGGTDLPPIVLCHDLGSSKGALVALALELQSKGFTTLLLDFRAHGQSQGNASTLGLEEKRDIMGAVDFLTGRERSNTKSVGVYGVGMGAHAAVLAAVDRKTIRVLVLDGVYPDAGFALARKVFAGWSPAVRHLRFLPSGIFALMSRTSVEDQSAGARVGGLIGRDLLFLASVKDPQLMLEMQRMYSSIPDQPDVDGNLVILPATQSEGLYGDAVSEHHHRVAQFFASRLVN